MSNVEYLANRRKTIESHHLLGKINSDEMIKLPKDSHDIITTCQNSIPKEYRGDKDILALSSLIGLNELIGMQMRILREKKLKELEIPQNG